MEDDDLNQYGSNKPVPLLKLCYACSTPLPENAARCYACNRRVGKINRHGYARKPFDWKGYGLCLGTWALFAFYIWWAFFREK